jgi:hypothetical protein
MVRECDSKVGVGKKASKLAKFERAVSSTFGVRKKILSKNEVLRQI